jgi:hypothetical protein
VFLGPHRLASYDGHGSLLSSPTASSLAACSTAAASPAQVGMKKRLPGRTKKLTRLAAAQAAMPWPNRRARPRLPVPPPFPPMKATDQELQKHDKFTRYPSFRPETCGYNCSSWSIGEGSMM